MVIWQRILVNLISQLGTEGYDIFINGQEILPGDTIEVKKR